MKSDMMKYKGYRATVGYDENDNIFIGEVFGISDSLCFHGRSIKELTDSFHDSIDNYLELCKKIGKEPQKEYTGSFNIRTTPSLHREASEYAAINNISLNRVVSVAVEEFLYRNKQSI